MGIVTFLFAGYGSYEIAMQSRRSIEYKKRLEKGQVMSTENWDPTEKYNAIAEEYDDASSEYWLGISLMRWWVTNKMKGRVLEVCAGTGKNIPYYKLWKLKAVHFVDQSPKMLKQCEQKWRALGLNRVPVDFICSSVEALPVPKQKYDVVYQTQGLCSCADPVGELKKLQTLVKPGGKIVLIEHGRGYYNWINNILDSIWEDHANKWGCITNRNIGDIVKESGLLVDSKWRWHFGTTWIITGHPPSDEEKK